MTEEQFLALQEQVNKNTQAIDEIKQYLQDMNETIPVASLSTQLIDLQLRVEEVEAKIPQMVLIGTTLTITTQTNTEST